MSERRVTASALSRIIECPASAVLPHTQSETPAAAAGTALHAFVRAASERGREEALSAVEDDDERADCELIDLDALPVGVSYAYEVGLAYDVTTGKGRELGRGVPRSEMYQSLSPAEIGGTFDVVALAADHVFLADLKRGQYAPPAKRNWQVRFGALAACRTWGRSAAKVAVIQRVGSRRPAWTRDDLDAFDLEEIGEAMRALLDTVARAAKEPHAMVREGDWCRYCPAWNACPAKVSLVRRLATGAELDEMETWLPLTKEMAGVAWGRLKIAKAMLGRLESAIYSLVKHAGEIPIGGGLVLGLRDRRGDEVLDGRIAHEVLASRFGGDVANAASQFTVSKKGIDRALRALMDGAPVAPRSRAALEAIRDRGGVTRRAGSKRIEEYEAEKPALPQPEFGGPEPHTDPTAAEVDAMAVEGIVGRTLGPEE